MNRKTVILVAVCSLFILINSVLAQGTAFTYQGQLQSGGSPANGNYDFTFALFNNSATNTGQVGSTLTNLDVGVTNGLFTITLDFGPEVFTGGSAWLAIGVTTNGGSNFSALNPLQELTPTPYAIYAPNSGTAANVTGAVTLSQLPGAVVTNTETGVTLSGTFSGNGGGLTNLPAAKLTGNLPAISGANLTGVALIAGGNTFNGNQTFTNGNIAIGTNGASALLQVAGPVEMGSGTGTTEAPNRPGLIVRRINSTSDTSNSVVAAVSSSFYLARDGTPGGFIIKILADAGAPVIAGTALNASGATANYYNVLFGGGVGTYQIWTEAQQIGYFRLTFGDPYNSGDMTEVVLTRFIGNGNDTPEWAGTVTSTFNQ